VATTPKKARISKDLRYRQRCFPQADGEVFDPKTGGYIPLPIITRKLLKYLKDAELRIWIYLQLRAGPEFICYPTYEDVLRDCGLRSKGTVSKAIRCLEANGFIRSHTDEGTRRYLIRDVRFAASRLNEKGIMSVDELEEINDLRERFGHPLITPHQNKIVSAPVAQKVAAP
jgi:hypothetical protein